jgi:oligoribonuclease
MSENKPENKPEKDNKMELTTTTQPEVNRLFWLDLEMTGLNVEKDVIIEAAALVTDIEFNILETYEAVVKQPQPYLDGMDSWNRDHHGKSGLTAKVPFGKDPLEVQKDLILLVQRHWANEKERPILSGNSISQDRAFVSKYWPELFRKLHYRMLDVSSWKIIFNNKFKLKYKKNEKHRALDDIKESIQELKSYLEHIHNKLT